MENAWGVKTTLLHPLDVYSLTDCLEMPGDVDACGSGKNNVISDCT